MRSLLIICLILLICPLLHAQWTERDSVWLQNVLTGKDTLRINPEFQKAIEEGTLLNPDEPMDAPRLDKPSQFSVSKDFSEYIEVEDTARRKIALKNLPPEIFERHTIPFEKILPVYQSIIEELKRKPPVAPATQISFDAASLTSRKTRVRKRNAKRSHTLKEYNELPTPDVISKRKAFMQQQAARKDSLP